MTRPSLPTDALLLHAHFVRRVARALAGGGGAEDLCQDTWVAALSRPPADPSALRSWLATVVRNLFRNQRHRAALRTAREQESARGEPVPRAVQGLTNESFLAGSGSGTTARAGNTTTVQATDERMGLGDATAPIPYADHEGWMVSLAEKQALQVLPPAGGRP